MADKHLGGPPLKTDPCVCVLLPVTVAVSRAPIGSTFDDHLLVRPGSNPERESAVSHRGTVAHNADYILFSLPGTKEYNTHNYIQWKTSAAWEQENNNLGSEQLIQLYSNSLFATSQITQPSLVTLEK